MLKNLKEKKEMNSSYKIKAILAWDGKICSEEVIKKFGKSTDGTIERNFLVPSEMPLWALHYALEKAFGFQNEHVHFFRLLPEDFKNLTNEDSSIWRKYVGAIFKSPIHKKEEEFWADDYQNGSFNNWRRKKYTAPYIYKGYYPTKKAWQKTIDDFIKESNNEFACFIHGDSKYKYCNGMPLEAVKGQVEVKKIYTFDELPIDALYGYLENSYQDLVETVTLDYLFKQGIKQFVYNYDTGDGWELLITVSNDTNENENQRIIEAKRPIMLSYKGLNLVEDVGGIGGYVDMLIAFYNLEEIPESEYDKKRKDLIIKERYFKFID